MGAMDKILGIMNIGNRDDDYDDYAEDDDGYVEGKVPAASNDFEPDPPEDSKVKSFEREKRQVTSQPFKKRNTPAMSSNDVEIIVFKPRGFDEAREIAETLLNNKIIVLDFEGVDISAAQRVLDIVTGACIAINGKLQKMSGSIFIATPGNVNISGEYLASQLDI